MTKNQKNFRTAFSFLEASIVILVIGIIILGITQSSRLIRKIKLSSAQRVTSGSETSAIPEMSVWFETTMPENLTIDDQNRVKVWNDYNTQVIEIDKINASQTSPAGRPAYVENGINGLPSLSFDGVNDNLSVRNFCANGFTIFVVLQTSNIGNAPVLWAGAAGVTNDVAPLVISGSSPSIINGGDADYSLTATGKSIISDSPHLVMINRNIRNGARELWVDGVSSATDANGASGMLLNANPNLLIGRDSVENVSYKGQIGEIIAFERDLEIAERETVEKYLRKKWGMKAR